MTHGGKRKGAGNKLKYGEPTKTMRIPLSLVPAIAKLLEIAERDNIRMSMKRG